MKNQSGITGLSFPFAAGVAAAALAARPFEGAAVSMLAAAMLLILAVRSGRRNSGLLAAMFFCLGFMCWCTRALAPAIPRPPSPTVTRLAMRIDGMGFPGDDSGAIIKALLTGRRDSLARSTVETFRRSGASHILALSGLHLGVLYIFVLTLLRPLGNSRPAKAVGSAVTVSLCGLYAYATGASPSIVRAFLFILINETGKHFPGRRRSALGTFCTALTIQLAVRPDFISSVGFQLSYLAMLGITVLFPRLQKWYPSARGPSPLRYIWNCAALSISCQAFTAPVVWVHFRTFPKYFLMTNLIAMPLTELLISGSVAALLLDAAGVCPQWLIAACGKMVQLMEFCLETVASI